MGRILFKNKKINFVPVFLLGISIFVLIAGGRVLAEEDSSDVLILDNFQEENWLLKSNPSGSMFWDYGDFQNGMKSLVLQTAGAGESGSLFAYKDIDFSVDNSADKETYLELDLKTKNVANLSRLYLTMYSDLHQGIYREAGIERTSRKNLPENSWTKVRVALQSFIPKVNETVASVGNHFKRLQFRISDNGQSAMVHIGEIRKITVPKKSYVLITFDDSYKSTISKAFPVLEQYGFKGTSFNIRENMGISNKYMTVADVQALENAGWANGLHGQSPNGAGWANLNQNDLDNYISSGIQFWQDRGINSALDTVAYPNGNFGGDYDNYIYNTVKKYIKIGRGTNAEMTEPQDNPTNPLVLRTGLDMYLRQSTSTDKTKTSLDRLAQEGGLGILVTHRIVDDNPSGSDYTVNQFKDIIAKLSSLKNDGKIEVLTMAQYRNILFANNNSDESGDEENDSGDGGTDEQSDNICVDYDGDGWGWDGEKGCKINDDNNGVGECVDWDGDGWGWDGEKGCKMNDENGNDNDNGDNNGDGDSGSGDENDNQVGECVDYDGDGWGWDGEKGCKINDDNNDNDNNDNDSGGNNGDGDSSSGDENDDSGDNEVGECVDWDGDGWGWDGEKGCKMNDENGGENEDEDGGDENDNRAGECVDWDGDGWGWDGEKGCKM